MWSLVTTLVSDKEKVEQYLSQGYEPFTVSSDPRGERVWLKKELTPEDIEFERKIQSIGGRAPKETNEAHSQPAKPITRGSKKTTPKSES